MQRREREKESLCSCSKEFPCVEYEVSVTIPDPNEML